MATKVQRDLFSNTLRHWRRLAGVSQRQLAQQLDVSPGAVSQWETGDSAPRDDQTVKNLEQVLKVPPDTFRSLLGFAPGTTAAAQAAVGVLEAIEADTQLGPRQRQLLRDLYRELVRRSEAER